MLIIEYSCGIHKIKTNTQNERKTQNQRVHYKHYVRLLPMSVRVPVAWHKHGEETDQEEQLKVYKGVG